jgi:hypothetical protein
LQARQALVELRTAPAAGVLEDPERDSRTRPAGDALVDLALEAEAERGSLVIQHRFQRGT